jgi:bacterioferritin (cytochrome b1)
MSIEQLIATIVSDNQQHAQWLNTLSLMENTGARKIAAGEHKTDVTLIVLKHAAEEHRHAFYLKKQIAKLGEGLCPTYANEFLLAPTESRHYLNILDIQVCKYLKSTLKLSGAELKFAAYLLVTYAIEVRADVLYPIYQDGLDALGSKVNVKSIIAEEEGHLEEMIHQLNSFSPQWEMYANKALEIENELFNEWVHALSQKVQIQIS